MKRLMVITVLATLLTGCESFQKFHNTMMDLAERNPSSIAYKQKKLREHHERMAEIRRQNLILRIRMNDAVCGAEKCNYTDENGETYVDYCDKSEGATLCRIEMLEEDLEYGGT